MCLTRTGSIPRLRADQNLYNGVGVVNGCNNDILRSVSTDGGLTLTGTSTPVSKLPTVSQESGVLTDHWWQWAALSPSGKVVDSCYDRRYGADRSSGFMDITLADGSGGHTRVTNLSPPPSNEFPASNGYSIFIGDYNALAVGSDGMAHPVWTDTRNPIFTFNTAPGADPGPSCSRGTAQTRTRERSRSRKARDRQAKCGGGRPPAPSCFDRSAQGRSNERLPDQGTRTRG